jgi:hypothetical protein
MKKSPWRKARDLCDSLHSLYIRARDNRRFGGICPLCRSRSIEVAFHFIGRACLLTRWDDDNVVGSCGYCNRMEMASRGVAAKERWRLVHIGLIGRERREALESMVHKVADYSVTDLADIAAAIRIKLKSVWTEGL